MKYMEKLNVASKVNTSCKNNCHRLLITNTVNSERHTIITPYKRSEPYKANCVIKTNL